MNGIVTTESLKELLKTALKEYDNEKINPNAVYYIQEVARMFKCSPVTVKRLIQKGLLKTTKDGKVSQRSLDEYLENKNN